MEDGRLVARIRPNFFGDMIVFTRHGITSVPRSQGDTKARPNWKAMLFRCVKSINTTMLEVDCGVLPLQGNRVTKVNEESVLRDKAIVINVRTRTC